MTDKIKILVIDDDPEIRYTFEAVLSEEGYDVELAGTGAEAIRKTREKWFNIALIDINLPDVSGIQLLTELKEGIPKMRKIIVTGYPTLPNAVEAVNKEASAYLIKPVDVQQMLNIIKEQIERQESEKTFSEEKVGEFMQNRARAFLESKQGSIK